MGGEECLVQALEMERKGKAFYLKTAAQVENRVAKDVFTQLAKDEDEHEVKIEEIYQKMRGEQPLKEWITCVASGPDSKTLFASAAEVPSSAGEIDALRIGLEMEEKSIKYYQELADSSSDRYVKRFYLALAQEEWSHYLLIMDAIEFMLNPEGWYLTKEHGMEDAG